MIWVDVRVPSADLMRDPAELLSDPRLSRIDLNPPAAGPEAQLSFGPYQPPGSALEDDIVTTLRADGYTVLASRTRANGWRGR